MTTIEEIAGVHLGKAGNGTAVEPYQTPSEVDASLLVAIPRQLNRTDYGIEEGEEPFVGFDAWNCYEFSTLYENGLPFTGVLKITYPSDSPNIVESKSLKLYLNSFNMVKSKTPADAALYIIKQDLSEVIGADVDVKFATRFTTANDAITDYNKLEDQRGLASIEEFATDGEDPGLLEFSSHSGRSIYTERIMTSVLRSNCRVTNQPDWGDLYVMTTGPRRLDLRSVLRYVVSMRNENHFHEEIVECVFKRLYDFLPNGTEIVVAALYTRRGGIDINPVRATSYSALKEFEVLRNVSVKTERQ